ncbi:MAG TPA: ATP-binding protein [Flavilitoribacter sp.]|nr:ATP-binding protein [Flavilitoribacter sp.]HMQ87993.1 ATP-binding protein [Flavilitoribacter sp.]
MVTEQELRGLMFDMESDRIERTVSFREDKLGPAVCAFSNDLPNHRKPGYLLLGVSDDGSAAGLNIGDDELQRIGNIRSNGNILPQPYLVVSPVFHFPEGDVVAVEVHPADFPPVRYNGRVYIRVGPRKGIASQQEERTLSEKRISTAKTFDEQPCNAPVYCYEFLDRIEIVNPGGLYGDVRPENFPNASDYRNPVIASAMKILGYVNRFNFGVKNAMRQLERNGNPQPLFNLDLKTKFFVSVEINPEWHA